MQVFDMNLLAALDALLTHGSVTQAAESMNLSVPAMSRTLLRIRKLMRDPIMVRAGRGLVPTPRALEIRARVHTLAQEAQSLVSASSAPLTEITRTFTMRAEDSLIAAFGTPITEAIRNQAPGITLRFVSQGEEAIGPLREGTIDLDLGNIKLRGPEIKLQRLFQSRFVGVVRPGHLLARAKITIKSFAAQEHISASRRGLQWGPIDDALTKLGLKRHIALVVPTFYAALTAAATSDMVAAIPEYYARTASALFGLHVFSLPVRSNPVRVSQAWHPRFDADPVHKFIRECVRAECRRANSQAAGNSE
jgi:DNA-binding transcriptional LysR family regulator